MYRALTYIMVGNEKKPPGSKISKAELKAAGQSDDNIKQLVDTKMISEDMDAELHADHQPITMTHTTTQRFDPDLGEMVVDRSITAGG